MPEDEPGIVIDELPEAIPEKSKKTTVATVLTVGIIFGFLIFLFAAIVIIINFIPGPDKLDWLLNEATLGNWILLVGSGLLIFFISLTISIYIWKRGRDYFIDHL